MTIPTSDLDRVDFADIVDAGVPRQAAIHPGVILREDWLEPLGITPYRAAKDMRVPPNRLTAILAGDRAITADTALRLARYFGTDARSWLNLQANYELETASLLHGAEIVRDIEPRNLA
jgi:addiction module HigA family antidote